MVHILQKTRNLVFSRCCFAEHGLEIYQELFNYYYNQFLLNLLLDDILRDLRNRPFPQGGQKHTLTLFLCYILFVRTKVECGKGLL